MKYYDKLIFELSKEGRTGFSLPDTEWADTTDRIPAGTGQQRGPHLVEAVLPWGGGHHWGAAGENPCREGPLQPERVALVL